MPHSQIQAALFESMGFCGVRLWPSDKGLELASGSKGRQAALSAVREPVCPGESTVMKNIQQRNY